MTSQIKAYLCSKNKASGSWPNVFQVILMRPQLIMSHEVQMTCIGQLSHKKTFYLVKLLLLMLTTKFGYYVNNQNYLTSLTSIIQ